MYSVVYVSSAVNLFTEDELEQVLAKSRKNNAAADVTGILLYKDGNFMQMLEGPRDAVLETLLRIEQDSRHRGIMRLLQQDCEEREFTDWSMGFKRLASSPPSDAPGYSNFLTEPLNSPEFINNPTKCMTLLRSFKKVVS